MGVKISRKMLFGAGSRGFRFENHKDTVEDQRQYEEGRALEEGRFRKGSLAQRFYALLSNPMPSEQHEQRSAHSVATVVTKQSAGNKSRKSAA